MFAVFIREKPETKSQAMRIELFEYLALQTRLVPSLWGPEAAPHQNIQ